MSGARIRRLPAVLAVVLGASNLMWTGACGSDGAVRGGAAGAEEEVGWRVGEVVRWMGGAADAVDFGRVGSVALLADGGVAAVDETAARIWVLPAAGAPVSLGGEGDGPGEFRAPAGMGAAGGDSLWVYDFAHGRITWISAGTGVLEVVRLSPPPGGAVAAGRLPDGSFVLRATTGRRSGARREGLVRDTVPLLRYAADGILVDTLGWMPGREFWLRQEEGRGVMTAAPLARSGVAVVFAGGVVWGDQAGATLQRLGPEGEVRPFLHLTGAGDAVTPEMVERWIERALEDVRPAEREAMRRLWRTAPVPPRAPLHGSVVADPGGYLWVEGATHGDGAAPVWEVFDAQGRRAAGVTLPPGFGPRAASGALVAGVARDELGVERVEVRVVRR